MIHTVENFFNLAADKIRVQYFPAVKYYRDDKKCEAATYAIELFNNGCLTYRKLIGRLAKNCNVRGSEIHSHIELLIVSFGAYKPIFKKANH